ncbi:MAG TPA: flotillin, partial [Rhodobacteraceae bacterium]|nr:flotillin [Paracoccaceae bacterium]
AIIEAEREAERAATEVLTKAQAEKEAAADRASAVLEEAQADASAITIRAEAKKIDMLAEAEGARAIADSENALSTEIVAMKVALARLEAMPRIVAEMVKPAEKIESIKIHQISGMNAGGTGGSGAGGAPVNQALDSIMGMALQMPAMKKLGEELGISMESGLASVTNEAFDVAPVEEADVSDTPAA